MSNRKLGDTFYVDFVCKSLDTGELATPDSGPTVSVYEDGTDAPIITPSPSVRNSKTGIYKVAIAATAGNGFEAGKSYNIEAEYEWPGMTGSVPDGQIIERFTLDNKLVGDLNDITAASVWAVVARTLTDNGNDISIADVQTALTNQGYTAARGGYLDRLDAAVTTRAAASDWTAGRAAKVDNLDVVLSTRAVEATVAKEATAVAGFAAGAKDATVAKDATAAKDATCAKEATSTAIKAKTDLLPADPASATNVAAVPAATDVVLSVVHGSNSWEGGGSAPTVEEIVDGILEAPMLGSPPSNSVSEKLARVDMNVSGLPALLPTLVQIGALVTRHFKSWGK